MRSRITIPVIGIHLLLLFALQANAQEADYTQYYLNLAGTNPGFTGMEDYLDLKAGFRQGWNDFNTKNNNFYFSAYSSLNKSNRSVASNNTLRTSNPSAYKEIQSYKKLRRKHGVGGMITNRNFGPYKSLTINANYAYHLPVSQKLNLSFGTRLTYGSQTINFTGYTVRDEINDAFYQQLIRANQGTKNSFLVDFGSALYSQRFYLGLSTTNFIYNKISGDNILQETMDTRYQLQTAFNMALGSNLTLNPGMKITYSKDYDLLWAINARVRFKELVYIGSAFDNQKKLSLLFGLTLKNRLSVNYSYDQYLSELKDFNVTMHEFVLGVVVFKKYAAKSKFW